MKIILLCDNPEEWQQCSIIPPNVEGIEQILVATVGDNGKNALYDVATEIKKETLNSDPCIIVVEQFLSCADKGFEWLQCNAGIALIKFLRILDVRHHIVLITPFEPIDLIKQDHGNLIVTSKGISFSKHHYDFSEKTKNEIEALATEIFDKDQDLEPYILADFCLPEDERHNWANWWGVVRLFDVHSSLFPKEFSLDVEKHRLTMPDMKKSLKSLKALRLYHHNVAFNKVIDEAALKNLKKCKNILLDDIDKLKKRINGTGRNSQNPNNWFDYIQEMEARIKKYSDESDSNITDFDENIRKAEDALALGKNELVEKENELETVKTNILSLSNEDITFDAAGEYRQAILKQRFTNSGDRPKPRILYIDDNAEKGWSEIFQILIYGEMKDENTFFTISQTDSSIDALYSTIKAKISECKPDLILLDLRLNNEAGTHLDVQELSGAKILEKIYSDYRGLPIMITTASNKLSSYKTLLSLGADTYWMKEGLEVTASFSEQERVRYSLDNHRDFIENVNVLCNESYSLRKKYGEFINNLKNENNSFWWKTGSWKFPIINGNPSKDKDIEQKKAIRKTKQCAGRQEVLSILSDTFNLFSACLELGSLGNKHTTAYTKTEWYYPSLVIQQLGKLIEVVHGFDDKELKVCYKNSTTIWLRWDQEGNKLFKIRNHASHYADAENKISGDEMIDYVKRMIAYLKHAPQKRLKHAPPQHIRI